MVTSRLSAAKKGTDSLRTTVPESVVGALKLKKGDDLDWVVDLAQSRVYCEKKEAAK